MIANTSASRTDASSHSSLGDVLEELCTFPRENVCCALTLALTSVVSNREDAQHLAEKVGEMAALPVNRRWELGQQLIEKLNLMASQQP